MSKVIRIDPEVYAVLERERREDERNWNGALWRILKRHRAIHGKTSVADLPEIRRFL